MDFLSTEIDNPFFYGYMQDAEFDTAIESIVRKYGTKIKAAKLTEALIEKGLKPEDLSPKELQKIDSVFDCY